MTAFQSISCRLCINICQGHRSLYDEEGRRNVVHALTTKYFTSMLFKFEYDKHHAVICLKCWSHIFEFHTFQQSVLLDPRNLDEVSKRSEAFDNAEEEPSFNALVAADEQLHGTEVSTNATASDLYEGPDNIFCYDDDEDPPESQLNEVDPDTSLPISISSDDSGDSEALAQITASTFSWDYASCRVGDTHQSHEAVLSSGREGPLKELELNTALPVSTVTERSHDSEVVTKKPSSTFSSDRANASSDEQSEDDESDDKWEEFDDPVGVFAGGEFDKSPSKITESESRYAVKARQADANKRKSKHTASKSNSSGTSKRKLKAETKESGGNFTSDDEMIVAEAPVKTKPGQTEVKKFNSAEAEPITAHVVNEHAGNPPSKTKPTISKRNSANSYEQRYTTALEFDVSESEGKTRYTCSFCPKRNMMRQALYVHMGRLHPKEWEERKKETRKHEHMASHPGKPMNTCIFCAKTYTGRNSLSRHLNAAHRKKWNEKKKEKEKKIYKCTVCHKVVSQHWTLREHMACHTGEIMYSCPFCSKTCQYRSSFYVHLRKKHRSEWEEINKDKGHKGHSILNIISKKKMTKD